MPENSKKGVPKAVLKELDIHHKEERKPIVVAPIVERHQIKLPVPAQLRLELQLKKGDKVTVYYDRENKRLVYQLT